MLMKKLSSIFFSITLLLGFVVQAQDVPLSYYKSINGLTDATLKNALYVLISRHNKVSSYSNLPTYFRTTDAYYENGVQYWWDMYSSMKVATSIQFGIYMNREHSFPKSWWGGSSSTPAYVDLYHMYPSEAKANQAKSNYPLGEVSTARFDNGVVQVGYPVTGQGGGSASVFEPADEYKGDFARTYFYMVTCYQNLTWQSDGLCMLQQDTYPTFKPWAVTLLLRWAREDPVSQKEVDRNNNVYQIQNNRNPFIDFPELCEYIWGNKVGVKFIIDEQDEPTGTPELTLPVKDSALDFSQVALGNSEVQRLALMGSNLRGTISFRISGTNADMFSIESTTIAASLVNAEGGTSIPVTYNPSAVGQHTATLSIRDGGLSGSRVVTLRGECLERPILNAPVATAATNIASDTYTANWEDSNQNVDYYIVTRTRYINGTSSQEDIVAETNSLDIEGFNSSTSESYNVRSVYIGVESPRSNEVFVEHSGVQSAVNDRPLGWAAHHGGVIILCGERQTNARIYDIAGRLVRVIPVVENNQLIELSLGVFIITTDQSNNPIRVLVN